MPGIRRFQLMLFLESGGRQVYNVTLTRRRIISHCMMAPQSKRHFELFAASSDQVCLLPVRTAKEKRFRVYLI